MPRHIDKDTAEKAISQINAVLDSDYHYDETLGYQLTSDDFVWLEEAKKALEKNIPKKPIYKEKTSISHCSYADGSSGFRANTYTDYFCPKCDWVVGERYNHPHFKKGYHNQRKSNFCNECGQAIDWSDEV